MRLAHRLPMPQYESDAQFARVRAFLQEHRSAVDEICFFTEKTNMACWPLDRFAENAALIARRLRELRADGFTNLGINMLNTLGHLDDLDLRNPDMAFPQLVGHDGRVARTCPCPTDESFRDYLCEKYRLIAQAEPEFIWVDDDFRMHSHTVTYGCFCPACIQKFGYGFTNREDLLAVLNSPEGGEIREAWIARNIEVLDELSQLIETVVHEVNRDIDVGLMTAGPQWTTYSGFDFQRWMDSLKGQRVRPGGGFYDDYHPHGMMLKIFSIAQQCQLYPVNLKHVQYEFENFPCQPYEKSIQSAINECTLSLAAGCNELSFSILPNARTQLQDYSPLFSALAEYKDCWQTFTHAMADLPSVGLWTAFTPLVMAKRTVTDGDWFTGKWSYDFAQPLGLS
ncbi:MAG TPA: hypothetical protein VHV83_04605, partial [Armatimonadota bacterium]|nr:hypothetical protein [Armatimonadota bacterium]